MKRKSEVSVVPQPKMPGWSKKTRAQPDIKKDISAAKNAVEAYSSRHRKYRPPWWMYLKGNKGPEGWPE